MGADQGAIKTDSETDERRGCMVPKAAKTGPRYAEPGGDTPVKDPDFPCLSGTSLGQYCQDHGGPKEERGSAGEHDGNRVKGLKCLNAGDDCRLLRRKSEQGGKRDSEDCKSESSRRRSTERKPPGNAERRRRDGSVEGCHERRREVGKRADAAKDNRGGDASDRRTETINKVGAGLFAEENQTDRSDEQRDGPKKEREKGEHRLDVLRAVDPSITEKPMENGDGHKVGESAKGRDAYKGQREVARESGTFTISREIPGGVPRVVDARGRYRRIGGRLRF
jgi:hypothetical protein